MKTTREINDAIEAEERLIKRNEVSLLDVEKQIAEKWKSIKDFVDGNSYGKVERVGKEIASLRKEEQRLHNEIFSSEEQILKIRRSEQFYKEHK